MAFDRPASLLTDAQRAYLLGEKEYRPSTARDVRQRVQQRIAASAADYALLTGDSVVPDFGIDFDRVASTTADSDLRRALVGQVAFAYKTAVAAGFDGERVTEEGVEQGKQDELAALREQLAESPETLTLEDLARLAEAGEVEKDSFVSLAESLVPGEDGHAYAESVQESRTEFLADVFVSGDGDDEPDT